MECGDEVTALAVGLAKAPTKVGAVHIGGTVFCFSSLCGVLFNNVNWVFLGLAMTHDANRKTPWPHAPTHSLSESGTYFLSVGTYSKAHHFRGNERLGVLCRGLLSVANDFGWQLEAWAVFSNHYHFVGHSPPGEKDAQSLKPMLTALHQRTAYWVNRLDNSEGRTVWHNFRKTLLTYEKSYLARLNYVHQNAVHHGLTATANQYPWCSAAWFEKNATPAQVKTIYGFRTNALKVYDDYEVAREW